jgi:uncharacterized membrane protein
MRRRDATLAVVVLTVSLALLVIPSQVHQTGTSRTVQARARVVSVDNSEVRKLGLVLQGEQAATVEIASGRFRGETLPAVNLLMGRMDIDKLFEDGDLALVGIDLTKDRSDIVSVNLVDHYRIHYELILFGLFCLLLVGFAGWTGVKALVSFVFTGMVIWKILLPVFLAGWNPIFVSLGIVTLLTAAIVFLVGGLEKKGLVAFLGALAGIVMTCVLSLIFGAAFRIHGAVRPFSETLLYSGYAHLNLSNIFLAGVFVASAGAVMDIAMDIAASMREVYEKHPHISLKDLIFSGFNVGRAVVGTMTTTLLFAYSGGYTTMLMVFLAQGTPLVNMFNLTYVAAEILQTLVGSFGLVLVAPLTALIGGIIYHRTGIEGPDATPRSPGPERTGHPPARSPDRQARPELVGDAGTRQTVHR